jgi:hypothetical protein
MVIRRFYSLLTMFAIFATLAACGAGEVGEECSKEADADECVDGAFCARNKAAQLECMQICSDKIDCPDMAECTGSALTIKVCQPKK